MGLKDRLLKLSERLHVNGRDAVVFLLSLLLAFSVWMIHNLSLNYSDTMSVPVVARCEIEGHSNVSSNSSVIVARCRTSGFNLLRKNAFLDGKRALPVDFDPKDMHHKEDDIFYVSAAELSGYVGAIFGEGVRLESFLSETVQFRFPYENNKRVPVQPVTMLSFRPQYMAMEGMKVQPDSVTIYGEPFHLEKVDRVMTKAIELSDIKASSHGTVRIEPITGVRMSAESVNYSLDVTRFVELSEDVAVTAKNVPVGKSLKIYPSTAKATFKCSFPLSENPLEKVSFYIDYADFEKTHSGKCIAKSTEIPGGVIEFSLYPEVFDCVEEDRR